MSATTAPTANRRESALVTILSKLLLAVIGSALAFSAFGLWLVPNATELPGMALIKLGLSLFMLISGMCCLVLARSRPR